MKPSHLKPLIIIAICCLGMVVYSNTLNSSFHLDDYNSITDNPAIKNIWSPLNIWNFWPTRFITYLSLAFNYHLHKLDVSGYHLFNLAVHLGSSILVWWLMLLTFSTPALKDQKISHNAKTISFFAGLIFVAHPIQTQAVTYIVQRAVSMATLFYLAS
ncbi:MAG: tetratricopeptide repeat protein, partial [Candidatus Bathyarchaeota archaeon]